MRILYHYHPETGELLGQSAADRSPLEPDIWLIPAHATDLPPPKPKARQVAVFRENQWQLAPDWRSAVLWSTENGIPVSITEIGLTPADVHATEKPRPSAAHLWQNGQWQEDADLKSALLDALKNQLCQQIDAVADQVRRELAATFLANFFDSDPARLAAALPVSTAPPDSRRAGRPRPPRPTSGTSWSLEPLLPPAPPPVEPDEEDDSYLL